ncbi:hypothetical protein [Azospirillum sp. TSO5]|uniref:hypothetical protein n=1 Tax=Azospirillum sp. TSO5 TaxID=716760 RepID=UPI0011B25DD5|nr:hypothetical protein [Azospirillum sp. TSO5]
MSDKPLPDVSDRLCPVCGGRNAYFGFGPPGQDVGVRWYCLRHRPNGQRWWASMRGAAEPE